MQLIRTQSNNHQHKFQAAKEHIMQRYLSAHVDTRVVASIVDTTETNIFEVGKRLSSPGERHTHTLLLRYDRLKAHLGVKGHGQNGQKKFHLKCLFFKFLPLLGILQNLAKFT